MKKDLSPRFKVWVEIERLKPNGDADPTWELRGKPCPDCVGTANTLKEAERIQFAVATAFGVDPEKSDCRPRGKAELSKPPAKPYLAHGAVLDRLEKQSRKTPQKCPACKHYSCICQPVDD